MLGVLPQPAYTIVLTAALTGLRKGELAGLHWDDFDGKEITVRRSVWNGHANDPKTKRSKSPIPVVKQLAEALEAHRVREVKFAQPGLPIFQAGNGSYPRLENLANRVIKPALDRCAICRKPEEEHNPRATN